MPKNEFSFIPSTSETAMVVKTKDWSKHALGNPAGWDPSLKMFLGFMFSSDSQLFLFWGDDFTWFYNDAFLTSFDKEKHPSSMGENGKIVWEVSWPYIGKKVEDVLKNGTTYQDKHQPIPNYRNGKIETVYWTYTFSPLYDLNGKVMGVIGNSMETTSENLAKIALAKAESQLSQAISVSKTGFYDWDIPHDVVTFSKQMQEDWGIAANFRLENAIEIMHPDDQERVKNLIDKSMKDKVTYSTEYRVIRPIDGQTIWLKVQGSVEYDEKGNPNRFFGTSVNITKEKDTEHKLQHEKHDLEQERDLRERFVAALSHDLRTPLTAAKFSAQILVRKATDPDQVEKMARRISSNMDRADNMIRDLLDATRIKAGESVSLDITECDLGNLTREVIEDLSGVHANKIRLEGAETIKGHWDCNAIRRTIENLATNAIKYGDPEADVSIKLLDEKNVAKIIVHNLGNPIPESELKTIFDAFKRSKATENQQKGWGLGLTLVKWFTNAHGGDVQVQSSPTAGTTFTIQLPKEHGANFENV